MPTPLAHLLAAASPPFWESLQRLPKETWINLAIGLVTVFVLVKLWRALKAFNDFAPYVAVALALALIFFYWVYERSEPRFLTPLVDKIAPFFPSSKG